MSVLVVVPLWAERAALAGRLPGVDVRHVGGGPARAAAAAELLRAEPPAALVVAGVCGALTDALNPGDLLVADTVTGPDGTVRRCTDAVGLATALRAADLPAKAGPLRTADHLVDGAEREGLAAAGALAVDTETATLLAAAGPDVPVAAVRAVADTPRYPLQSAASARTGLWALRSLRRAGPVLATWSARTLLAGGSGRS